MAKLVLRQRVDSTSATSGGVARHELTLVLYGLPSVSSVRVDFPSASGASIAMLPWIPAVRLGASYGGGSILLRNLTLQPHRLYFETQNAPPELPIIIQLSSEQSFLFGWLQVPDNVQTAISTAAQRMRVVGSTYWAIPLVTAKSSEIPGPTPAEPPTAPPAPVAVIPARADPAPAKPSA